METDDPTAAQKRTFRCSCLHPHQKLGTQGRRGENGVLQSENSSSPQSDLNYHEQSFLLLFSSWKKAASRQQPRWKAPSAAAGRGADNGGGIHYKGIHTYTCLLGTAGCHMGWWDSLRRQQLPSNSLRCSTPSPSPSPDGKQIPRKTPARHWAVQEREGFVLHASQQPHHAPHREKSLLAYNSHPPKTLSFICN